MSVAERIRRHRTAVTAAVVAAALALLAITQIPTSQGAFVASISNTQNVVATAASSTCRTAVTGYGAQALFAYPFGDAPSPISQTVTDISGNHAAGTYSVLGVTRGGAATPCPADGTTSIALDGLTGSVAGPAAAADAPSELTEQVWFRTTTTRGGALLGYDTSAIAGTGQTDRVLYLDDAGHVQLGVGAAGRSIASGSSYNDGAWHLATATVTGNAVALYVDGSPVAASSSLGVPKLTGGYWRFGWGQLNGWPATPTSPSLRGDLAFGAVFSLAMTPAQVFAQYQAGR